MDLFLNLLPSNKFVYMNSFFLILPHVKQNHVSTIGSSNTPLFHKALTISKTSLNILEFHISTKFHGLSYRHSLYYRQFFFFFYHVYIRGDMKIRTNNIHFIKRSLNQLSYFLWIVERYKVLWNILMLILFSLHSLKL